MEKQMLEMMQQILQKVSSLETKVDNIDKKVNSLDKKIDKIELKMNDGFETLELLNHETIQSVTNVKIEVKKLDNRLTNQVAQNLELIQELKSKVH